MRTIDEWKEIFAKLAEPFPPEEIEWRVGSTTGDKTRGIALAYITSRAAMDRFDEVLGPGHWKDEYRPGPDGGVLCGISININGEWVTKWDGADNTQVESVKGGLSDAFKRAAYKWGVGRYLYGLENVWVAIEPAGKSFKLKTTPTLPDWALPKGYKKNGKAEPKNGETKTEAKTNGEPVFPENVKPEEFMKIAAKALGMPVKDVNLIIGQALTSTNTAFDPSKPQEMYKVVRNYIQSTEQIPY